MLLPNTFRSINRGPHGKRGVFVFLLLTVLLPWTWAQAPFAVQWQGDRLSVVADRAPLAQILSEIARKTGRVDIQGIGWLQRKVSVRFSEFSLRDGLQKLLEQVNYTMIESEVPQKGQPDLTLIFRQQQIQSADELEKSISKGSALQDEEEAVKAREQREGGEGIALDDERAAAARYRREESNDGEKLRDSDHPPASVVTQPGGSVLLED